jgi:hypothetical protein
MRFPIPTRLRVTLMISMTYTEIPAVQHAEGARLSEPSDRMSIAAAVPWWMDGATLARCNNINNLRDGTQIINPLVGADPLRQRHKRG